ncbi:MAG: DUF1003 domain-containing protein [Actinomycetes bacterium]
MARDTSRGRRIDQPLERGISIRPSVDPEAVGRLSERIARFLGSWRFIGYMTAFVAGWLLWNTLGPESLRFDKWQFIGLTLLLSLQASYAAPLILLAQNRQSDRDRVQYQDDRAGTERLIADTEYLMREIASLRIALGEVATRDYLRSELRDALDERDEREPKQSRKKKNKQLEQSAALPAEDEGDGEPVTEPVTEPTTAIEATDAIDPADAG